MLVLEVGHDVVSRALDSPPRVVPFPRPRCVSFPFLFSNPANLDQPSCPLKSLQSFNSFLCRLQSYEADLMVPHTVIQVTPATPSSTDSSRNSSNILENLLDELQTFSKEASSTGGGATLQRSSGSLRSNKSPVSSDGAPRKGDSDACSTGNDHTASRPVVHEPDSELPLVIDTAKLLNAELQESSL